MPPLPSQRGLGEERGRGGGGWAGQELPLGPEGVPQPAPPTHLPACRALDARSLPTGFSCLSGALAGRPQAGR